MDLWKRHAGFEPGMKSEGVNLIDGASGVGCLRLFSRIV